MKKIIISALIICSSFTYAATPNEPKQAIDENLTSVQWAKPPKPSYTNDDLQGSERTVTIKMYVSEDGSIKQTKIVKSRICSERNAIYFIFIMLSFSIHCRYYNSGVIDVIVTTGIYKIYRCRKKSVMDFTGNFLESIQRIVFFTCSTLFFI